MVKLLVVDDAKIKRLKLARSLRSKGFKVKEAKDGMEAVKLVEKKHYDVMIIDTIMPKLTGFDACKIIQNKKLDPHLKVVMMLGYGSAEDYPELPDLGIDKAISKPVNIDEVLSFISESRE